jgi:hypothetical protein
MTVSKRVGIFLMVGIIGLCALELGERLSLPGVYGVLSSAEAVVGRPLTPVSVAGVGRRTVRRCAAGVYNC